MGENFMNKGTYNLLDHLKFIIPSLLGVLLFMTPVKTEDGFTIPNGILANWIQGVLANKLSLIMMLIIIITAIMIVTARIIGEDKFNKIPFFKQLFYVCPFWMIKTLIVAVYAIMVYFNILPEAVC